MSDSRIDRNDPRHPLLEPMPPTQPVPTDTARASLAPPASSPEPHPASVWTGSEPPRAAILQAQALSKYFAGLGGAAAVEVLRSIDLAVPEGASLAIIGTSGSGKSTLLHLLGALDKPSGGRVWISGRDPFALDETARGLLRNRMLGFVYQFHHLLSEFSALDNVAMPLYIRRVGSAQAREQAAYMLEQVGLAHRLAHKPSELSGGERQRTAIARALVTSPRCILADEPTGNLDTETANAIFDLLLTLNQRHRIALVIVTHDPQIAARTEKIYQLSYGQLHPLYVEQTGSTNDRNR